MKTSFRDLLSWVWQIILTWLTGGATGTDLPLCIERPGKMGVKATDPELAVGHDMQEVAAVTRNETPGLVLKNEQVTDTFLRSDTGEVVVATSDRKSGDNEGIETEEASANRVETDKDENVIETDTDSNVMGNNDSSVAEDNSNLINFDGEDNFSNHNNKEETENIGNEEENISRSVLNAIVASSTTEVNDGGNDSSNPDEANNVERSDDTKIKNQKDNVNDSDEDYDDDDDDDYSETNDVKVTWLLKLSSREIYQKVLAPQYYCLNFRTVAPLKEEDVRTAIRQLRSLLPWLGFGLRRQKEAVWLCMYPENYVDFQTADDEDHQWYVVANCREQFSYLENGCVCIFRLMKSYPCTQCQTDVLGTNTSSVISNETSACSSTASSSVTKSTSAVSATMTKDTSEIANASHCVGTGANSGSIRNVDNVTGSPSIINKFSNTITEHDTCTASPINSVTENNSTVIHEAASFSCNTENESASNTSVNPSSAIHTVNDNKETITFTHNYRLIFGVPQPLADEISADVICDTFIKELDNVISRTTMSVNLDLENKNSCDMTKMNLENGDTDMNSETSSGDSDNQVNNHQPDNTAIVSDNDINNASVSESNSKQVNSELNLHQHKVTDSNETQEKNDEIKASIQQQLTIIENILAGEENVDEDKKDKGNVRNNNVNAINRNSPHIARTVQMLHSQNFINKCKTERVTFVSGFAACVNAALANILVKYGIKEENHEFRIGHIISVYYNLEDLSDQEWHDHDDGYDDDDDIGDEERRRATCCKAATATLNIRSKDWYNQFWERVQWVDKKRWDMSSDSLGTSAQKIPLSAERENNDERFPSIYQPSANLSISNISGHIPKFSREMENIESMTLQRLSPLSIFLMTNSISLTLHKNCLRFSFYHQNLFVPHHIAHHYADEIVAVLKKSLVS